MDDQAVLLCVLIATLVLLALVRIFRVTKLVKACEWVGFHACCEAWSTLRHWAIRRSLRLPLELARANFLVRAGCEWLNTCVLGVGTRLAQIVLAWVLIRVTKSVALELTKGLLRSLALVHSHAAVQTNLVTLLAESLVICA